MNLIQTKAKAFGVFAGKDGSIIYIDPKHNDERHHSPRMSEADAASAFERGLIDDPKGAKTAAEDEDAREDPNNLPKVATERVADVAALDAKTSDAPSNLSTRQTTAFQNAEEIQGGDDGIEDEDAAPAPKARTVAPPTKK